jgi:hypothetical protein
MIVLGGGLVGRRSKQGFDHSIGATAAPILKAMCQSPTLTVINDAVALMSYQYLSSKPNFGTHQTRSQLMAPKLLAA